MSSCDCSFVVVKAEVLSAKAQECLDRVEAALKGRRQCLDLRIAQILIDKKHRWYHFGRNKGYFPTQEEIDAERQSKYPWYRLVDWGWDKYTEYNLDLRVKKEVAERLLAAANMGETITVSTTDIQAIS